MRVAVQTDVQEVVLTGGTDGSPLDLYLDGRLRVSGRDEYRYHEALVHPAMNGPHARVLILGGGDGLAAREVLRYPDVRQCRRRRDSTPASSELARTDPALSALNAHAYDDPRLTAVTGGRVRLAAGGRPRRYDVVISDLPDPGITASTKLYSQEFYGLVAEVLAPGGRLAVHAGPLAPRPRTFWTVDATVRAAGLRTAPYRVGGRRTGFAAGPTARRARAKAPHGLGLRPRRPGPRAPALGLSPRAPQLRSLTAGGTGGRAPGTRSGPGCRSCRRRRWCIRGTRTEP